MNSTFLTALTLFLTQNNGISDELAYTFISLDCSSGICLDSIENNEIQSQMKSLFSLLNIEIIEMDDGAKVYIKQKKARSMWLELQTEILTSNEPYLRTFLQHVKTLLQGESAVSRQWKSLFSVQRQNLSAKPSIGPSLPLARPDFSNSRSVDLAAYQRLKNDASIASKFHASGSLK